MSIGDKLRNLVKGGGADGGQDARENVAAGKQPVAEPETIARRHSAADSHVIEPDVDASRDGIDDRSQPRGKDNRHNREDRGR